MKTHNLRKVIIPSFALLIGASLAATISSTLAWFQYSTSARIAYVGAMTHCTKLLKISVDNGIHWGNDYYQNDMESHIEGNHLLPITTGPHAKDKALTYYSKDIGNNQTKNCVKFYKQPDFGYGGDYSHWYIASDDSYAQFTILVKVNDMDGATNPALENDVFITKIIIQDDSANAAGSDLSDAVRVHVAVTDANLSRKNLLFAKSATPTKVGGKLDLNNDGVFDKDLVAWDGTDCIYGDENGYQYAYAIDDVNAVVEDPDNPADGSNPISLGKTGSGYMRIVVTTWIEGWAKLDHGYEDNATGSTDTAVWDPEQYVNKKFNVGIRLGVKSHESDHQNQLIITTINSNE